MKNLQSCVYSGKIFPNWNKINELLTYSHFELWLSKGHWPLLLTNKIIRKSLFNPTVFHYFGLCSLKPDSAISQTFNYQCNVNFITCFQSALIAHVVTRTPLPGCGPNRVGLRGQIWVTPAEDTSCKEIVSFTRPGLAFRTRLF